MSNLKVKQAYKTQNLKHHIAHIQKLISTTRYKQIKSSKRI